MGFFFTLLYLITAYVAPDTLFGDLAQYHIELGLAALALGFGAFSAGEARLIRMTQTYAILGLTFAVILSMIVGARWFGGIPGALGEFVPDVAAFFMIVLTCKKKWQLQVLVAVLFLAAMFTVLNAEYAISAGLDRSPYLLRQTVDEIERTRIIRIQGKSFLGDPNDFAQFMVALIPCVFLFWVKGNRLRNFLMVYVPVGCLIFGMYETHSRGGMVALMVVCIVAGRKKIGVVPAIMIGLIAFAGMTAIGFSGGRDVAAGQDRMSAWGTGFLLLRSHPIFGVGFERFSEFNEITAHNTFVVTAAELGIVGVFFWVLFMFVTIRNVYAASLSPAELAHNEEKRRLKQEERGPSGSTGHELAPAGVAANGVARMTVPGSGGAAAMQAPAQMFAAAGGPGFAFPASPGGAFQASTTGAFQASTTGAPGTGPSLQYGYNEEPDPEVANVEVRRMAALMVVSFGGFLAAGWFLSRAYTMVLFVNAGIAAAIYNMAWNRGIAPPQLPLKEAMKWALKIILCLLLIVYMIVRVDNFMPH